MVYLEDVDNSLSLNLGNIFDSGAQDTRMARAKTSALKHYPDLDIFRSSKLQGVREEHTMYAVPGEKRIQALRKILPWKAFRTIFLPLVVACSSAARSGTPCPPLELRPCCMSPERPF